MALITDILKKTTEATVDGVAYKNLHLKKSILSFLTSKNATIAELSKELSFSSPKISELITILIESGLVKDCGKIESGVGRRPTLYGLNSDSLFFIGADVRKDYINIGMLNFNKELVSSKERIPFQLLNTQSSLDQLCEIIQSFIEEQEQKEKIIGVGLNLTGRINFRTGYSYSYFHFNEEPLSQTIERALDLPVILENDSRAMAYGEFSNGVVKDEKNVIFINIDYGIGTGIMIDGHLLYGKSGFAGEFGHIPVFDNEIICQCGKRGCLETEASGYALTRLFIRKIKEGHSSIISKKKPNPDDILLEDIVEAAKNDDVLAIELIGEIGEKLGRGMAILINLYNPELVILGGIISTTGDYIQLPIKSAIHKYSLRMVNEDTELKTSILKEKAGIIGACLLVRDRLLERGERNSI